MANREREKQKRENALNRFRGMDDLDEPEDEDERERQAQADDEEVSARLFYRREIWERKAVMNVGRVQISMPWHVCAKMAALALLNSADIRSSAA